MSQIDMENLEQKHHEPVLLKEVIEYLEPRQGDVIVDATFGFGGHSKALLERIGPKGRLIAIEQDSKILEISREEFDDSRITFVNDNFSSLESILKNSEITRVNKIIFDLGISSYHFDKMGEGFSFKDQKLDMRLNRSQGETAADLVNELPENELADLLYRNADEYLSRRIARVIVEARKKEKITSALELATIIGQSVRKRGKTNPATKTFQALRIAVNDELDVLDSSLPTALNCLARGGRIAVISFHSHEDRITKEKFKNFEKEGLARILTKKPLTAQFDEIRKNPRARSAKLRVIEKL